MRTKKIFLNMLCDITPYLLIGIVGLVKVNFLIKYIGDVGNGYYQTINQIITYVFLAQIGFGDAVIFSLYKVFAKEDKKKINEIYSGSRVIFRKIGFVILGIIGLVSLILYLFYGFEDGYRNSSLICFIVISCSYLISYFGKGQTYMAVLSAAQEKYVYSIIFNSVKLLCDVLIVIVTVKFRSLESIAIVPSGSGANNTQSAITPLEKAYCILYILSLFSPHLFVVFKLYKTIKIFNYSHSNPS